MARICPLLTVVVFLASGSALRAEEKLTRDQMEEDLRELGAVIRRTYSYVDEKKEQAGVDLDKLFANALKRLDEVKSNDDYHDLLKEVVAGLKDGHCEVYAWHLAVPRPRAWPFLLHFVKEGVVINGIHPSLAGHGINIGDLLKEVNGRPVERWVEDAARKVSASSDGARRRMALERMAATADESVKVKVEHKDGTSATVIVKTFPQMRNPVEPNVPDLQGPKFAAGRVLKDGVGYVRIPSFWYDAEAKQEADLDAALKPARDQIDAAFAAVADTKALVLDLRGNGGGRDLLGAYLVSHLVADDFCYYTLQNRSSPDLRRVADSPDLPREDGWAKKTPWSPRRTIFSFFKGKVRTGRLVVLINELGFSTTDCVAAALADLYPNVRFVGRPTNGGSGRPMKLATLKHSRADVQLCVMRVWSPKGRLIEGHGTRPDVPVEWTRDDVLKGRDADLEAALNDLRR